MPRARPNVMARKIMPISRADPAAERNRTREKPPATATPAPMLPFTSMITTATMAGIMASVMAKLWEYLFLYMHRNAVPSPKSSASPVVMRNADAVIWLPVKIVLRRESNMYLYLLYRF